MPDQTVLSAGGNTNGDLLNLSARSTTGKWFIAYIAEKPDITVNLAKITSANSASAKWISPATGSQEVVGTYPVSRPQPFRRPAEWQDAVLVVIADVSDKQSQASASASADISQPNAMPAKGPLRVHPANPCYFTDGSGKAILLTGSHTSGNLQDYPEGNDAALVVVSDLTSSETVPRRLSAILARTERMSISRFAFPSRRHMMQRMLEHGAYRLKNLPRRGECCWWRDSNRRRLTAAAEISATRVSRRFDALLLSLIVVL